MFKFFRFPKPLGCAADISFAANILKFTAGGITAFFFFSTVGTVEGRFFPVAVDTQLHLVGPDANGFTRVDGTSEKLRPGCKFDHIEWYLGAPEDSTRADFDLLEPPKNRKGGPFSFGPWMVQLTPEQIVERSYAMVFHRCHDLTLVPDTKDRKGITVHLWLTESIFWQPGEVVQ